MKSRFIVSAKHGRRRVRLAAVRTTALIVALAGCGGQDRGEEKSPAKGPPPVDFASEVRPILASRCFKCHGPDDEARQAGLRLDVREGALAERPGGGAAVVPGAPGASRLIARVTASDPKLRMPPASVGDALTPVEVATLRRWIGAGAPWGEHWSFRPLVAPPTPSPVRDSDARDPLDLFVEAKLRAERLVPAGPASTETLLRRVALDLTGLPPTPDETAAHYADTAPGAYERLVDRLLASPHFGEHWARWWADLARYADTKGYEKDDRRTIWPWRDWVVDAFNADLPLDVFAAKQLAGDLLPDATDKDRLATAFHRHTMNNDEGGTDDEEFRVAAVVDRVNTTGEVFLGLTVGCAQCHTHKYDPLTQTDYFRLFALFNQTADADTPDEAPTLRVPTAASAARRAERARRADEAGAAARAAGTDAASIDVPWLDDELPEGAAPHVEGFAGGWPWTAGPPTPASGKRAFGGGPPARRNRQVYVTDARAPLRPLASDRLYVSVFVDPAAPPREIMLQWHTAEAGWGHRAYYGENADGYGGEDGSFARKRHGDVPAPSAWTRLEIDAAAVGLVGRTITGWAFSQVGGTVHWDAAGLRTTLAARAAALRAAVDGPDPSDAEVPVLRELAGEARRKTRRFVRGSFLNPAEEVSPGVPGFLAATASRPVADRADFARWLFAPENPLTARVMSNRVFERLFGTGLVETLEDFGVQGSPPTHPELLDHLAARLRDGGWRLKPFVRAIVLSSTYRRASAATPTHLARDPRNRLLARAPRFRLEGERLRDQALAASDLLSRKLGGPPVFPPQPAGVWSIIYSNDDWRTSEGEDRYRRGLYTFWRRTSPYPAFTTFDAPSREVCASRRLRTNTPLHAYVTLNDPAFVEAAQALARRVMAEARTPESRVRRAFRRVLLRAPTESESRRLAALAADESARLRADLPRATTIATDPLGPLPEGVDPAEAAGWTLAMSALLNLDETLTRE